MSRPQRPKVPQAPPRPPWSKPGPTGGKGISRPRIGLAHRDWFLRDEYRMFRGALKKSLAGTAGDYAAVIRITDALVDKAEKGDLSAIAMVADRLDGKPGQQVNVTATVDNHLSLDSLDSVRSRIAERRQLIEGTIIDAKED